MRKKAVSVKQIQNLDKLAIEKYGVPSIALMENAGKSVACEVLKYIKRVKNPKVVVVCGLGNNAGDGFVVARHLINAGIKTQIFLIGKGAKLKADAAVNYKILKRVKHPIVEILRSGNILTRAIKSADVIVDAIFGVGLNRNVEGVFRDAIETINEKGKRIVSVDIPSGLNGTTGKVYGVCVKAHKTVTFSFVKKGFLKGQGPKVTGKVAIVDIGIPIQLLKKW